MKCIDDELIQRYMDGETDSQETARIEIHMADCSSCARNLAEHKAFADAIKIKMGRCGGHPVIFPEFVTPAIQKRKMNIKIRRYIYAASAACAAFLLFFLISEHNDQNRENGILLIYSFDGGFDSNKTVLQQEMTVIMMDANVNVVEYK